MARRRLGRCSTTSDEVELPRFPKVWSELPPLSGFVFERGRIRVQSADVGALEVQLPESYQAVVQRSDGSQVEFSVGRTDILDRGRRRSGWLLRERVRLDERIKDSDAPRFGRFFWFVCSLGDAFLLLKQDDQRQFAALWRGGPNGTLGTPVELSEFDFRITENRPDESSGREHVPTAFGIDLRPWQLQLQLRTEAHHTGTGPDRKSGKALYRQATVVGQARVTDVGVAVPIHGMLELILEN